MAYSDYGGYAYRNGDHVQDRSDVALFPEGLKSSPGRCPVFVFPNIGTANCYHVTLGDGPIFVGLYKQSSFDIYRNGELLPTGPLCTVRDAPSFEDDRGQFWFDNSYLTNKEEPTVFEVDGHRIEFFWTFEDNYYQYVKMTQPDGTVWLGFSGYGVGEGLEDCGYGASTEERVDTLFKLFEDT